MRQRVSRHVGVGIHSQLLARRHAAILTMKMLTRRFWDLCAARVTRHLCEKNAMDAVRLRTNVGRLMEKI